MTVDRLLHEAIAAHRQGDISAAKTRYEQVLRIQPDNTAAMTNLAAVAISERDYANAERYLRRSLSIRNDDPGAHSNLGVVLRAQGRFEEAVAAYYEAIRLKPNNADAYHNLGNTRRDQGRLQEAIAAYKHAIQFKPNYADAYNNLGNALKEYGRSEEAIAAYEHAISINPNKAEAYNNLAAVLQDQRNLDKAIAYYRKAIQLNPSYAEAHNNLATALRRQGRIVESIASYRDAIKLKPDYADAYGNVANAFQDQSRLEDAISAYEKATQLKPNHYDASSQLIHQRQHACDWASFETDQERLLEMVRLSKAAVAPFLLLASRATAADQLLAAQKWAHGVKLKVPDTAKFRPSRSEIGSKIKLGYLSADFHQHATAYLMAELFERHDRACFEVVGYSYGPDDGSDMRQRLTRAFDRLVDIRALSDREAARQIYEDRIDILVDLKGYTIHARTEIMAHRPAPIQLNYLGYPGTMGAEFMDYLIVDSFIAPIADQRFYSEKLVHLPDCYQPNDTKRRIAKNTPSRSECGLPERDFVFCCFNNSYKITPTFFDIWLRLLKAVPGSVLWLLRSNGLIEKNLRRETTARGIDPDRLIFAPRTPLPEHLARHRQADLFLDTLPCNAHTTASDALWAGLPVLTCAGKTFAGRVAGSLLRAAGTPELITSTPEEYEALALKLAKDPYELAGFRRKVEQARMGTPLFDIARFTKNLETAYRCMRENYCAGRGPTSFSVSSGVMKPAKVNSC